MYMDMAFAHQHVLLAPDHCSRTLQLDVPQKEKTQRFHLKIVPRRRSVGLARYLVAAGSDEEVEVRALVGLHHVIDVEPLPPTGGSGVASQDRGGRATPLQLVGRNVDVEPSRPDVELDDVAGLDEAQGTSVRCFGSD